MRRLHKDSIGLTISHPGLVELIDTERNCPHHSDEVWSFKSGVSSQRQGAHISFFFLSKYLGTKITSCQRAWKAMQRLVPIGLRSKSCTSLENCPNIKVMIIRWWRSKTASQSLSFSADLKVFREWFSQQCGDDGKLERMDAPEDNQALP